jgi:predicted ATPase
MSEKSESGVTETPQCAAKETKNSLPTDVCIEGLLGVGNVELCFAPGQRVHVLFGANGVGKTKCLESIWKFLFVTNREVLKRCNVLYSMRYESTDIKERSSTRTFVLDDVRKNVLKMWGKDQDDKYRHDLPVVFLGAGYRAAMQNWGTHTQSPLGSFEDRRDNYFLDIFKALDSDDLRNLSMSDDSRAWFVARARSANPYEETRDNRKVEIDAVLSMLHDIEPRIDAEFLAIDGSDHVFLKVDGEKRELGELSSGFAALLKMIQAIVAGYAAFTNEVQLRNVRGIVLVDEIDAHLHPEWQARIVPCLKKLLPNTTFYIATHSPLVLVRLMRKEAYLLRRDEDGVVRSREVEYPNRRLFIDVLEDGFGVDLNRLKRDSMEDDDQSDAKQALRKLLEETREAREARV